MKRYLRGYIIGQLIIALNAGMAAAADVVTLQSQSAMILNQELQFSVGWFATNPVAALHITVGSGEHRMLLDQTFSRKHQDGYRGTFHSAVGIDLDLFQHSVPFSVVLEDTLGNRSEPASGRVLLKPKSRGLTSLTQGSAEGEGNQAGSPGDGNSAPVMGQITVKKPGGNLVSFASLATDDQGLHEVRFQLYGAGDLLVGQQAITALGKHWEGSSKTFKLAPGSYRVVGVAFDAKGIASGKQVSSFDLYDVPKFTWGATVAIVPQDAARDGAMWQLDGGQWQNPGASVQVPVGIHRVTFKEVPGWQTPGTLVLEVKENGVAATATYRPRGEKGKE